MWAVYHSRGVRCRSCLTRLPNISNSVFPVKFEISKTIERWLLYKYVGIEFTPLTKPFKTKKEAEKARENILSVCARGLGSV
jgi:hypothetical protein